MTADESTSTYVSTPKGLVTAAGRWYHIPEEAVREYAAEVLDHVSLETLVRWAEVWVESPTTVTLWGLPLLLWTLPSGWAAGGAVGLYVGWALLSPAFPGVTGARVLAVLRNVFAQGGYYALTMSALARMGHLEAMGVGGAGFVLMRWGVVDWAGRRGLPAVRRWVYPLPVTDQVLRGLIIRAALTYRVSVPQVEAMTTDILNHWNARSDAAADADPSPPASE